MFAWSNINNKNNSRPNNVSTNCVVIDEAWWGNFTVRGFNISTKSTSNLMSKTEDEINAIFKIYVPQSAAEANKEPVVEKDTILNENGLVKSEACVSEITVIDGVEYRTLTAEAMGLELTSYYWSEKVIKSHYTADASNAKKYASTRIFEKEELVDGVIIWVGSGWQYRPEGWIGSTLNTAQTRPVNSTAAQTVNDSWWGSFDTRAFNISMKDTPVLADKGYDTVEEIYENFKIYIPVDKIAE